MEDSKRVLSVQSHVVHGYVGNKSAVFPLQLHNYEVDYLNSVQLSCHTRQVLSSKHLETIYDSLKRNGSVNYDALLTGYVGDPDFLLKLWEIVVETKSSNPRCRFYCDPVLGDDSHIYVPEELIPIYKEKILPISDVLMPNQFEAELLSGCKIIDEESAFHCIDILHSSYGIPTIIFSSTELPFLDEQGCPLLSTYISYRPDLAELRKCGKFNGEMGKKAQRIRALFPKMDAIFFGTGDLFSSLTLIYFEKYNDLDMMQALYKIQCTMHAVLERTLQHAKKLSSDPANTMQKSDRYELRLVQSAKDILNPPDFVCVRLDSL